MSAVGSSVDAGVHIWRREAPDRPWMPGRKAHLPEPLTYEKFGIMMQAAGVEHAILVPPSWEGDRVDYSLEAAQKYPNRFAVMGRFPIDKPSSAARFRVLRPRRHSPSCRWLACRRNRQTIGLGHLANTEQRRLAIHHICATFPIEAVWSNRSRPVIARRSSAPSL